MNDTDKAAAIAALGGPNLAREALERVAASETAWFLGASLPAMARLALAAIERPEPTAAPAAVEERIAEWERFANAEPCGREFLLTPTEIANAVAIMRDLAAESARLREELRTMGVDRDIKVMNLERKLDEACQEAGGLMPSSGEFLHERLPERIRDMQRQLAAAEAAMQAVDDAIADRGVPERDCRLPLDERVSNIISELKNWRHQCAEEAMRADRAEAARNEVAVAELEAVRANCRSMAADAARYESAERYVTAMRVVETMCDGRIATLRATQPAPAPAAEEAGGDEVLLRDAAERLLAWADDFKLTGDESEPREAMRRALAKEGR